ncbi:MAG: polyprenyl synthetase family protein [Thermoplasmata archaeon]|nr:MAG: polyprenyl synthetase family protein [Thermoplasmata archaeon]
MDLVQRFGNEIEEINKALKDALMEKEPRELYDAARHLPLAGGKRLRPLLVLLASRAVGGSGYDALPFGLAIEIIHNFTLVHDDIMDRSTLRRGVETVHVKFGEPTAIIAGDVLFAKAFEVMHKLKVDDSIFRRLNGLLVKTVKEICEGQQLDMEFEKRTDVKEKDYLTMIEKKTAALFSCSTEGGGIVGGGSEKSIKALANYGKYLGLAFQIRDDYLDLCGKEEEIGKRIGNDIRDGKKTIIIAHAVENLDDKGKRILQSVLGNRNASDDDISRLVGLLKEAGSIDYAREKALFYSKLAAKELDKVEGKMEVLDDLKEIANYAATREK